MISVINNTTLQHIAKCDDWSIAHAWAETIPMINDFSIVWHCAHDLSPYTAKELSKLCKQIAPNFILPRDLTRVVLLERLLELLDAHEVMSEMPPDTKRVAPFIF